MKCFNCKQETNPTLVYCNNCGVPLETSLEDLQADEEERVARGLEIQGLHAAKRLFVLSLFLFGLTVALRMVILYGHRYDAFASYQAPAEWVLQRTSEPPESAPVVELEVPLPETP